MSEFPGYRITIESVSNGYFICAFRPDNKEGGPYVKGVAKSDEEVTELVKELLVDLEYWS